MPFDQSVSQIMSNKNLIQKLRNQYQEVTSVVILRSDRQGPIINLAITTTNGFLSIYGVFLKSQEVNEIKNYHICFDGITAAC